MDVKLILFVCTVWINELNCKMDMDDQSLVSALQDVYRSHELPLKPVIQIYKFAGALLMWFEYEIY